MTPSQMITATFLHPDYGRNFDSDLAKEYLEVGKTYNVDKIEVYPYSSYVFLEDIEIGFNSVLFDFYESGKEYNPTEDPKNYTWSMIQYLR